MCIRDSFGNALLRLFKLLGGYGGLSLAADLVLLDKQLHKAAPVSYTHLDVYKRQFGKCGSIAVRA